MPGILARPRDSVLACLAAGGWGRAAGLPASCIDCTRPRASPDRRRCIALSSETAGRGRRSHAFRSDHAHEPPLAEQANGPIPRRKGSPYVWGAALGQLERMQPDARIINLETAVTRSHDRVNKSINYRVSPENAACLAAAKINCCALANNHVLAWGRAGLLETLNTLQQLHVKATGAGRNDHEARAPAVLNLAKARLLIFSFGSSSSGI